MNSVDVHATAKARAGSLNQARYAAPIAVDILHPMLQCSPDPCFRQQTEIDLEKTGPGAFRLINLDREHGGTGQQDLADWILHGFAGLMPLDNYYSDPGAKFNASQVISSLNERIGDTLLFPVYDDTKKSGANFDYHVIGWVGFTVTGFDASGNNGKVFGYFTESDLGGNHGQPGRRRELRRPHGCPGRVSAIRFEESGSDDVQAEKYWDRGCARARRGSTDGLLCDELQAGSPQRGGRRDRLRRVQGHPRRHLR